jgi:hypothetical protein
MEEMLIDLHWLLIFLQLDSTLLNSRLDLLAKDFAIIHTVRDVIMPLAVLRVLQLISRWDIMIRGKPNLLLP